MIMRVAKFVIGKTRPILHDKAARIDQPGAPRDSASDRPSAIMAETTRSAMPVAASPAPRNSTLWSASFPPVTRSAENSPASATAAVPNVVVEDIYLVAIFVQ